MQCVPVSPLLRLFVGPCDHSRLGASLGDGFWGSNQIWALPAIYLAWKSKSHSWRKLDHSKLVQLLRLANNYIWSIRGTPLDFQGVQVLSRGDFFFFLFLNGVDFFFFWSPSQGWFFSLKISKKHLPLETKYKYFSFTPWWGWIFFFSSSWRGWFFFSRNFQLPSLEI